MTEEIQRQSKWTQEQGKTSAKFEEDRLQLNIQSNQGEVLVCKGRIRGHYPIYLPDTVPCTCKLVRRSHIDTLHRGVGMTLTKTCEQYWVPQARKLVKQVIKLCRDVNVSKPSPQLFHNLYLYLETALKEIPHLK